MALVSLRQLLDHAAENNYGIPAFNVNNLEQVQAIMQAASEVNDPVIMQASPELVNMPAKLSWNTSSKLLSRAIRIFRYVCIRTMDRVLLSVKAQWTLASLL